MKILHIMAGTGTTSIPMQWVYLLKKEGHNVDFFGKSNKGYINSLLRAKRLADKKTYQVVHLHHTFGALVYLLFYPKTQKAVLSYHRNYKTMNILSQIIHLLASLKSKNIITNSSYTKRTLPKVILSKCNTQIIYNGVNWNEISYQDKRNIFYPSDQIFNIVSVGRLIPEKNYDELIRFIALAKNENNLPSLRLTIIGNGKEREKLLSLITKLNLNEHVYLAGELPRLEVISKLRSFQVFYMPSLTEGFCNAMVEAMASEVPILCTPTGALPEVLENGGWIARGTSAEDLLENFIAYFKSTDDEKNKRLKQAMSRAQFFSMNNTIQDFITFYEKLAK